MNYKLLADLSLTLKKLKILNDMKGYLNRTT
jgi:hypothetical protein